MAAPIGQIGSVIAAAPYTPRCIGFGQLTLSASPVLLSTIAGGIPNGARWATISVETANARFRDDGVAPTSAIGVLLVTGTLPFIYAGDLTALQLVANSGSPVVNVSFYGPN